MKHIFTVITTFLGLFAFAQDSLTTTELQELIIVDDRLHHNNYSQHVQILPDSLIEQSSSTFTDFLLFNTPIYFKENGSGMVSSPSFRGTTAQQTAVLWNGIEINSLLLGQTDFNSLSFKEYDEIAIKPGGGSVLYGSGAIGGTIHLNNAVKFSPHFEQQLQLSAGSFDTYRGHYHLSAGIKKWYFQANLSHNQSKNDFSVKGRDWKNTNGEYVNNNLSTTVGYQIDKYNELLFLTNFYADERHFALVSPNQNKSKYENKNIRNLLSWKSNQQKYYSDLKIGYLYEKFEFTENINTNSYSDGAVNTWLAKHDFDYQIGKNWQISSILYYKNHQNSGKKSSLEKINQNVFSAAALSNYQWNDKTDIELGIKQEWAGEYTSPLLFSGGLKRQFSDKYISKINVSRNFRAPTLNDLFWQPGGNKDLRAENSWQIDWANTINIGKANLQTNIYWTKIEDMIRWLPTADGFWAATNTNRVNIKGLEMSIDMPIRLDKWKIDTNIGYAYNESLNQETDKWLVYTPKHKVFGGINFNFNKFLLRLQGYYNGKVYTTAENNENNTIKPYGIINADVGYKWSKHLQLLLHIKNLTDSQYENTENRPMPGINYNVQLIINL